MIRENTFTKVGIVLMNELKIAFSLFACFRSRKILMIRNNLRTERPERLSSERTCSATPPLTIIKSKRFHLSKKKALCSAKILMIDSRLKMIKNKSSRTLIESLTLESNVFATMLKDRALRKMMIMMKVSKYL